MPDNHSRLFVGADFRTGVVEVAVYTVAQRDAAIVHCMTPKEAEDVAARLLDAAARMKQLQEETNHGG